MEPYIYSFIKKEQLEDMIISFQRCTYLTTQVIDENGTIILSSGEETSFCNVFRQFVSNDNTCEKVHIAASKKAINLGETYIFTCHSGLNHIAFPLINKDTFFGSVIVGPFLMEKPDASLILDLSKKYTIPTESLLSLAEKSHELEIITPERVVDISRLLNNLISNIISDGRQQLIINHGKLIQQSKINDSIQMYKNSGYKESFQYPYEQEKLLISKVKIGDIAKAKELLNDILGFLFLTEAHNVTRIKIRLLEICALLSRASIDAGADTNKILEINTRLIENLMNSTDLYDLCFNFQENVDVFTDSLFFHSNSNSERIKTAANYITRNYSEAINLEQIANQIHINPAYLSSLFKQVTGKSFKDYLNSVRVEESKRLLSNTDYSILDIAIACGFEDQSYFTKVFKKYTGMTPKQYR